jgi:hypothetical protein
MHVKLFSGQGSAVELGLSTVAKISVEESVP